MKRTLTFATMLALGAAAYLPLPSMAQTSFNLVVRTAPPAPRFETVPPPRHGYVWAPGYWNWDGGRHVWLAGHWESARDGYRYQPTEWVRDGGGYALRTGGWQPVQQVVRYDEIRIAPPAPRYERIPRARPGYIWQPGYWEWRGNRYDWIGGVWIAERPGYVYTQPSWHQRDGRWYFEQPRWASRGDRDRDGIPDRYEHGRDRNRDGVPDRYQQPRRDSDRDGVPDRRDHDRDNDGVPNNRDARPTDPRYR